MRLALKPMIESKIYAQINNFIKTNYETKVHVHALLPYLWEPMGSWASHYLFVVTLPLHSMLFSLCFQNSQLAEGFSAKYLIPKLFADQKHINNNPSSIFA